MHPSDAQAVRRLQVDQVEWGIRDASENAMLPSFGITYLLTALGGTPDVLDALLAKRHADDPVWDARPDPERFTTNPNAVIEDEMEEQ